MDSPEYIDYLSEDQFQDIDLDTGQTDSFDLLFSNDNYENEFYFSENSISGYPSNEGSPQQEHLQQNLTMRTSNLDENHISPITTQILNFQRCTNSALFENNFISNTSDEQKDSSFRAEQKARKRKMNLSSKAQKFKDDYYSVFTKKKKFPKPIVKKIHLLIEGPLNLKPFTRSISRFNDMYFDENAYRAEDIIKHLCTYKSQIIASIPELNKYC